MGNNFCRCFLGIFLLALITCSTTVWAKSPPFAYEEFEDQLLARLELVPEFKFLKSLSKQNNLELILGEEAFATFANYVFWDLNRLCMLKKFKNKLFEKANKTYYESWLAPEESNLDIKCAHNNKYNFPNEYNYSRGLEYNYTIDDIYYPSQNIKIWHNNKKSQINIIMQELNNKFSNKQILADGTIKDKFEAIAVKKYLISDSKKYYSDNLSRCGLGFNKKLLDYTHSKIEKYNRCVLGIYKRKLIYIKYNKLSNPKIFALVHILKLAGQFNLKLPGAMIRRQGIFHQILNSDLAAADEILKSKEYYSWLENELLSVLVNSVDNIKTRADIKLSGLDILIKLFHKPLKSQTSGERKVDLSINQLYLKEPFLEKNNYIAQENNTKLFLIHRTPSLTSWHNIRKGYDGRGNFFITRGDSTIETGGTGAGVYFSAQQSFSYGENYIVIQLYQDPSLVVGNYYNKLKEYCLKDKAPIIKIMHLKDLKYWREIHNSLHHQDLSEKEYLHDLLLIHGLNKTVVPIDEEINYREKLLADHECQTVDGLKELATPEISFPEEEYLKRLKKMYYGHVEEVLLGKSLNTVISAYNFESMPNIEEGIRLREQIIKAGHVQSFQDLQRLSQALTNNPCEQYMDALREFYVQHVPNYLPKDASIEIILEAYKQIFEASSVNRAIEIRKQIIDANLIKNWQDLQKLSWSSLKNPSQEEKNALRQLYIHNLPKFLSVDFSLGDVIKAYKFENCRSIEEGITSRRAIIKMGYVKNSSDLSMLVQPGVNNAHPKYIHALDELYAQYLESM